MEYLYSNACPSVGMGSRVPLRIQIDQLSNSESILSFNYISRGGRLERDSFRAKAPLASLLASIFLSD